MARRGASLVELLVILVPFLLAFAGGFWLTRGLDSLPLRIGAGLVAGMIGVASLFLGARMVEGWLDWRHRRKPPPA